MNRKTWIILIILGAVIAIPAAWYLISPLFINRNVDEAFPTSAPAAENIMQDEAVRAEATETMQAVMQEPAVEVDEAMPEEDMDRMQVLAQGEFYDIAHHGMGTATVYQLADGSHVLRFENFEVLNGPDLHVYLAPQNPVADTVGVELEGATDLGPLKGNIGSQNYVLPSNIDPDRDRSVVIWCVPFRVPFNAAALEVP